MPASRSLPSALKGAYDAIVDLQRSGRLLEAASKYPAFLASLGKAWGEESPDLAAHHYNFSLLMRLAGRIRESAALARSALSRWPGDLGLRAIDATCLAELAIARNAFDEEADRSFRMLLEPSVLPRLRAIRLSPQELFGQWAEMLLRAGRSEAAIGVAHRSLALDARDRHARDIEARALVSRHQPLEAIPILEGLIAERPDRSLDMYLGIALLESGDPSRAWERFSKIRGDRPGIPVSDAAFDLLLATRGARALNQLGRHAEAAELMLGGRLPDRENVEALTELAAAARGLGALAGARALDSRVRALQQRERLLKMAAQARAARYSSSVPFYRAEAALEVQRIGEALSALAEATSLSPRNPKLRLEVARIRLLLGRNDLAEGEIRDAIRAGASPMLTGELARILALRGAETEALRLIDACKAELNRAPEDPLTSQGDRPLVRGLLGRALLGLGRLEEAKACVEGEDVTASADDSVLLCRAELAILRMDYDDARRILGGTFDNIGGGQAPGASSWARALSVLLPTEDGETPAFPSDPSDLLDHSRLLGPPYRWPHASSGVPERLRAAIASSSAILATMRGHGDRDMLPRWHEVLRVWAEAGASRKCREVAWYLVHLRPDGPEELRALARTLSTPADVVVRLEVAERGLMVLRGDEEFTTLRNEARRLLGLQGEGD